MSESNAIQPFDFKGNPVRVVMIDGEPWFVAVDVAKVLGYRDAANATRTLRDREVRTHPVSTSAGLRELIIISEQGLYRLVMRSERSEAEDFQDWVTGDLLPQIRTTGAYLPVTLDPALQRIVDLTIEMQLTRDEQRRQAQEIVQLASETADHDARLAAIEGHHDWYAALGYARLNGLPTSEVWLQRLGITASQVGKAAGLVAQKVPHAHYGRANSWPTWVWDEAVRRRRVTGEDML